MAVYTTVTMDDLTEVVKDFNLGTCEDLRPIAEGIENTNYLLDTTHARYILTLFEKRTKPEDIPYFIKLMQHLNSHDIPCPFVLQDTKGRSLFPLKGKSALIASFLEGRQEEDADIYDCFETGVMLARMHLAGEDFKERRETTLPYTAWRDLIASVGTKADTLEPGLADKLQASLARLKDIESMPLPKGTLHADLFPDNVFFEQGKITGVIDFYFACHGYFVYDIMLTLNAWCGGNGVMDEEKAHAFLKGYEELRPLSDDEVDALAIFGEAAALRIVSTRLYDWFNTDDAALVKKKNPIDHVRLLDFYADPACIFRQSYHEDD